MSQPTTQALVVHCMDFRLQKYLDAWLERELGYGQYDRVSLAGGVFDRDLVMKHVELSYRLHHIQQVVLINHEDCGAYGMAGSPERHAADLRATEQCIRQALPTLAVKLYYLHLNGVFEPVAC